MKFCPNCGAQIAQGVKFCTECGTKIAVAAPPAYEPPAPSAYEPPVAPAYEPPAAPAYEPPAAPAYEPPVAPAYEPPAAPAYEPPAAPTDEPPETPIYRPQVKAKGGAAPKTKQPREKKPGKKKGILAAAIAAAAVLILVLLLLGGSNQGAEEVLGRYEAVSCTMDGGSVSVDGEWIDLQKKGKAKLCIMDEEYSGKWQLDGETFTLKQSGDLYTGVLRDGMIAIDLAGMDYVFAKEGAAPKPVTYKATALISAGQILDEELLDSIGGCYLRFHGDGTGTFWCFGDRIAFTYDGKTITMDGDVLDYTVEKDTLEFTYVDGSGFTMEKTEEDPEKAAMTNGWEGDTMETEESELLSYLKWPGQTFSALDLSDATLSLQGTWGEATVWFKTDADGASVVESMNFYVEEGGYEDLRELLVSAYGEPTDEGEEPYAESNGGTVSYCWFNYPAGTLCLMAASEYDFVQILVNTD